MDHPLLPEVVFDRSADHPLVTDPTDGWLAQSFSQSYARSRGDWFSASFFPWGYQDTPKIIQTKKTLYWLVVYLPLWKILISQLGWLFPIYGKIKTVPNHQPVLYILLLKPVVFEDPPFQECHLKAARVDSNLIRLGYVTFRNGRMWETQAAINLPWLGMVNIPPIKMVMSWGQFIWFMDVYWVYHITQHSKLFQAQQMLSEYRLGLTYLDGYLCKKLWSNLGAQWRTKPQMFLVSFAWALGMALEGWKRIRIWIPEWTGSSNSELVALQMPPTYGNMLQAPKNMPHVKKQLTSGLPQYWVWITALQVPF